MGCPHDQRKTTHITFTLLQFERAITNHIANDLGMFSAMSYGNKAQYAVHGIVNCLQKCLSQ